MTRNKSKIEFCVILMGYSIRHCEQELPTAHVIVGH